jgi:hypothetical protein
MYYLYTYLFINLVTLLNLVLTIHGAYEVCIRFFFVAHLTSIWIPQGGWLIINCKEIGWKLSRPYWATIVALIKRGLRKPRKSWIWLVSVPAKVRTGHIPRTSLQNYRFDQLARCIWIGSEGGIVVACPKIWPRNLFVGWKWLTP